MSKWYSTQGNNSDVVVSSKIRLARNLSDAPFPCKMSTDIRKSVSKRIFASIKNSHLAGEFDMLEMTSLDDLSKISLAEKSVISPQLARQSQYGSVLVSKDESTSIMLCEEDHIRLSVTQAGQNLEEAYKKADEIDDILIKSHKIAFSKRLGFLTSNPMNLGTGLKASLVLHLPAINERKMMSSLTAMVGKLGFSVRRLYGAGDFYELSNSICLGITEKNALDNLNAICNQIVKQERSLRQELMEYGEFEDKLYRAFGTLKMARRLPTEEFYSLISLVRLGISMGCFDESYENVGELMHILGTATIMSGSKEHMTVDEADKLRAQYVREKLG